MSEAAFIEETAEVVAEFVANNTVAVDDLPALISSVQQAFAGLGKPVEEPAADKPTATPSQIRKSVTADALISFEDGRPYKSLKRHLTTKGLTPEDYRTKWGLPKAYPMVAPGYSAQRSLLAKAIGLGRKAAPEPVAEPPKRRPGRPKKAA